MSDKSEAPQGATEDGGQLTPEWMAANEAEVSGAVDQAFAWAGDAEKYGPLAAPVAKAQWMAGQAAQALKDWWQKVLDDLKGMGSTVLFGAAAVVAVLYVLSHQESTVVVRERR